MFIKHNLYHEIHKAALERRRDPLKIGSIIISVLICFMAFYYFYKRSQVFEQTAGYRLAKAEWIKLESAQAKAIEQELKDKATIKNALDLLLNIENRPLITPILNTFAKVTPANLQLIKLNINADFPNKIAFTLNGIVTVDKPNEYVEDYRISLSKELESSIKNSSVNAVLRSVEDSKFQITIDIDTTNKNEQVKEIRRKKI